MKTEKKIVGVYEDKEEIEEALERIENLNIDVEKRVKIGEVSEDEVFEEGIKKKSAKRVMAASSISFILVGIIVSIIAANGGFGGQFETTTFSETFVMVCGGFCLGALLGMFSGMVGALAVGKAHYSFKDHFDIDYYTILLKTKSSRKAKKVRNALNFDQKGIDRKLDILENN